MRRCAALVFMAALLILTSCGGDTVGGVLGGILGEAGADVTEYAQPADTGINRVDIRFELVSLIFRLAGFTEYNARQTAYQNRIGPAFNEFSLHPAVEFARNLHGFDAPLLFAVHLVYSDDGFALADETGSLVSDWRWTERAASEFAVLVNDFYRDSYFADFFHSEENESYFVEWSDRLYTQLISALDKEWFAQFGLEPDRLTIMLAPSHSFFGRETMGLSAVRQCQQGEMNVYVFFQRHSTYSLPFFYERSVYFFSLAIANPLSETWYTKNGDFRAIADGAAAARQYLFMALMAMYYEDVHGRTDRYVFLADFGYGFFPRLDEVIEMLRNAPSQEIASIVRNIRFSG